MRYSELQPDPWMKAKDWIIYPDAAATELLVLDCELAAVDGLAKAMAAAGTPQYVSTDVDEAPAAGLEEAAAKLASGAAEELSFSLEAGKVLFQVSLGRVMEGRAVLVLSFWKDQAYSKHVTAAVHREVFMAMVQLGLDLCEAGRGRAVLLAPESDQDPRSLLRPNAPGQILWQRP